MTAIIVTPPTFRFKPPSAKLPSLFLAGSIEMGAAEDWQTHVVSVVAERMSIIYNPRRPDWNPDWAQVISDPQFNVQVNWELDMIAKSDLVAFYFDPNTKSPITLMELGFVAASKPQAAVVCCPDGFWRKGNVDIMCERTAIHAVDTLDDLLKYLTSRN